MLYAQIFLYLQVLDYLTTMVGFRFGIPEASPMVRLLMHGGPAAGVMASKLIALGLAGVCLWLRRPHVIRWANYWYAALVVWNLCAILTTRPVA